MFKFVKIVLIKLIFLCVEFSKVIVYWGKVIVIGNFGKLVFVLILIIFFFFC